MLKGAGAFRCKRYKSGALEIQARYQSAVASILSERYMLHLFL